MFESTTRNGKKTNRMKSTNVIAKRGMGEMINTIICAVIA